MRSRIGNMAINALVIVVIAGLMLGFIILGFAPALIDKISFFRHDFNNTRESAKGLEILRYNIGGDSLAFHDGERWADFEGKEVKLGDKRVVYSEGKGDFERYFYDVEKRDEGIIQLNLLFTYILFDLELDKVDYDKLLNAFKDDAVNAEIAKGVFRVNERGVVTINLKTTDGRFVPGFFTLDVDNKLYYNHFPLVPYYSTDDEFGSGAGTSFVESKTLTTKEIDYFGSNALSKMVDEANKWRNSIFVYPIEFLGKKYCSELQGNRYIVVDLSEEFEGERCEG